MNHDFTPLSMFLNADIIVKLVIFGLVFASLVTWTIGIYKFLELRQSEISLKAIYSIVSSQNSLESAIAKMQNADTIGLTMLNAIKTELHDSSALFDTASIKERVALKLSRLELAAARSLNLGTGLLATIGSTAPFVGLFGTVWGIMNSFIGISKSQTTNLAIVAPGIAEALFATAIGLVAAIPAVIIYNHFARVIAARKAKLGDIGSEVARIASLELDYRQHHQTLKQ